MTRIRVLRVIARMNIGGPAHHVSLLSGRLDPSRYETLLVTGGLGPGEDSLEDLAATYGATLRKLQSLGPAISPRSDLRALFELIRIVRAFRPDIVHTHTAKAGALGRIAALFARGRRPVIVHTYHGHVLRGYFGPIVTLAYRSIETALATVTDRLLAVSSQTADELASLKVSRRDRFEVVHVGLELDRFLDAVPARPVDGELAAKPGEVVALFAGRLVSIKRVDVLLDAHRRARDSGAPLRLLIAGDGELRPDLEQLASRLGVANSVVFLGFRRDLDALASASDLAVLSSDNEGTPVALIEAAAAGLPLVSTDAGGVREIVRDDTGIVVPIGDSEALGEALVALATDPERRAALGRGARAHVREQFTTSRLVADIDDLYSRLLHERAAR